MQPSSSKSTFWKSFLHASRGIIASLSERNMRVHLFASIVVVSLGFYLRVPIYEWVILILCIALVLSLEMINSAIERLCDELTEEHRERIKFVKDVSAGAVFIAAIASTVIAVLLFYPHLN